MDLNIGLHADLFVGLFNMPNSLELKTKPEMKYQKLTEGLRAQIQSGALKPGDRLPSIAEMYEQHKLSRSTVERVHRQLEEDGLVIREQGRGTFVTRRRQVTGFVGVSGYCFEERPRLGYWAEVLDGMRDSALKQGYGLALVDHGTFGGWGKVDGIVIADPVNSVSEALEKLPSDLPRISVLNETPLHTSVSSNDYQGGQVATQHLLDLGHRRIACMMDRDHFPTNRRFDGYKEALKGAGIQFDQRWIRDFNPRSTGEYDFLEFGKEVMRRWLSEDWHELGCTALLAQNDLVAFGAMRVLQDAGISIPGQISVIGYDDLDICDLASPGLTSVHVPLKDIGRTTVNALLRQIETGTTDTSLMLLPVSLHLRRSTGPAPH